MVPGPPHRARSHAHSTMQAGGGGAEPSEVISLNHRCACGSNPALSVLVRAIEREWLVC